MDIKMPKPDKLEKKTCEACNHLEDDGENIPFYYCNIHKREIFDPTKAGCHHRDRRTKAGIDIRDYVGAWFTGRPQDWKKGIKADNYDDW